ncbi:MAG: hypothetical protein IKX32_00435 [Bacteroidales bacterium]|nr:hypothetical protein [Bacteroidales bacterium]
MKKNRTLKGMLLTVAVAAMSLTLSSCNDEVLLESVNTRVMEATVEWTQWIDDGATPYFYKTIEWDGISTDVLQYGNVQAYVYDGNYQCPLPYIYPLGLANYDDGSSHFLVEQISYDLEPGKITFKMQDLDGNIPQNIMNTAPITFRVVATVPVQYILNN